MCIILTCERGVRPSSDLVGTCFWNNPDGAGIMWCEGGRVQTSKGFMSEGALERAIAAVPEDSPLVVHMRIATSGGVSAGTCHPFPVSGSLDVLHAANVECDAAIAHNGVIRGMRTNDMLGVSDTVSFVMDFVSGMWRRDNKVTRAMRRRIADEAPGNRFAIMTKDGRVTRIGEGWESVSPGIEASNSSWRHAPMWGEWPDLDWYKASGYTPVYMDVFDMLCGDCPNVGTCIAYGAACDDVAGYIDECDCEERANGGARALLEGPEVA